MAYMGQVFNKKIYLFPRMQRHFLFLSDRKSFMAYTEKLVQHTGHMQI